MGIVYSPSTTQTSNMFIWDFHTPGNIKFGSENAFDFMERKH